MSIVSKKSRRSKDSRCIAIAVLFIGSVISQPGSPAKADMGDALVGGVIGGVIGSALSNGTQNKQKSRSHKRRSGSGGGTRSRARAVYTEQHKLQQALADLGFYTGAIDGTNGTNTRAAISQFQASKQLPRTGVLTQAQRGLLLAEADLQKSWVYLGTSSGPSLPPREHKKRIQAALQVMGHYNGSIDGIFGGGTSRAVKNYQLSVSYPPTGVLTPEQELAVVDQARDTLTQRLAGISQQYALMAGLPVEQLNSQPGAAPAIGQTTAPDNSSFPPIEAISDDIKPKRNYDVAVVIGNKSYSKSEIPDVAYGDRDAEAIRAVLVNDLGFDPDNIIWAKDASQGEMRAIFGSENNIKGTLWRYIDPDGKSEVVVYYSGHGAPDINSSAPYLLPVDSDPDAIALNGYSLDLMYNNLSQLPVKSVSVMLDACFSGGSPKGMLISSASPVMVSAKMPKTVVSSKITVLAAADGNELASWDDKKGHGIFTSHIIRGLKGEADTNGDKAITARELHEYVRDAVRRQARREFGREQTPKLMGDPDRVVGVVQ